MFFCLRGLLKMKLRINSFDYFYLNSAGDEDGNGIPDDQEVQQPSQNYNSYDAAGAEDQYQYSNYHSEEHNPAPQNVEVMPPSVSSAGYSESHAAPNYQAFDVNAFASFAQGVANVVAQLAPMPAPAPAEPSYGTQYFAENPDVAAAFNANTTSGMQNIQAVADMYNMNASELVNNPDLLANAHYELFGQNENREIEAVPNNIATLIINASYDQTELPSSIVPNTAPVTHAASDAIVMSTDNVPDHGASAAAANSTPALTAGIGTDVVANAGHINGTDYFNSYEDVRAGFDASTNEGLENRRTVAVYYGLANTDDVARNLTPEQLGVAHHALFGGGSEHRTLNESSVSREDQNTFLSNFSLDGTEYLQNLPKEMREAATSELVQKLAAQLFGVDTAAGAKVSDAQLAFINSLDASNPYSPRFDDHLISAAERANFTANNNIRIAARAAAVEAGISGTEYLNAPENADVKTGFDPGTAAGLANRRTIADYYGLPQDADLRLQLTDEMIGVAHFNIFGHNEDRKLDRESVALDSKSQFTFVSNYTLTGTELISQLTPAQQEKVQSTENISRVAGFFGVDSGHVTPGMLAFVAGADFNDPNMARFRFTNTDGINEDMVHSAIHNLRVSRLDEINPYVPLPLVSAIPGQLGEVDVDANYGHLPGFDLTPLTGTFAEKTQQLLQAMTKEYIYEANEGDRITTTIMRPPDRQGVINEGDPAYSQIPVNKADTFALTAGLVGEDRSKTEFQFLRNYLDSQYLSTNGTGEDKGGAIKPFAPEQAQAYIDLIQTTTANPKDFHQVTVHALAYGLGSDLESNRLSTDPYLFQQLQFASKYFSEKELQTIVHDAFEEGREDAKQTDQTFGAIVAVAGAALSFAGVPPIFTSAFTSIASTGGDLNALGKSLLTSFVTAGIGDFGGMPDIGGAAGLDGFAKDMVNAGARNLASQIINNNGDVNGESLLIAGVMGGINSSIDGITDLTSVDRVLLHAAVNLGGSAIQHDGNLSVVDVISGVGGALAGENNLQTAKEVRANQILNSKDFNRVDTEPDVPFIVVPYSPANPVSATGGNGSGSPIAASVTASVTVDLGTNNYGVGTSLSLSGDSIPTNSERLTSTQPSSPHFSPDQGSGIDSTSLITGATQPVAVDNRALLNGVDSAYRSAPAEAQLTFSQANDAWKAGGASTYKHYLADGSYEVRAAFSADDRSKVAEPIVRNFISQNPDASQEAIAEFRNSTNKTVEVQMYSNGANGQATTLNIGQLGTVATAQINSAAVAASAANYNNQISAFATAYSTNEATSAGGGRGSLNPSLSGNGAVEERLWRAASSRADELNAAIEKNGTFSLDPESAAMSAASGSSTNFRYTTEGILGDKAFLAAFRQNATFGLSSVASAAIDAAVGNTTFQESLSRQQAERVALERAAPMATTYGQVSGAVIGGIVTAPAPGGIAAQMVFAAGQAAVQAATEGKDIAAATQDNALTTGAVMLATSGVARVIGTAVRTFSSATDGAAANVAAVERSVAAEVAKVDTVADTSVVPGNLTSNVQGSATFGAASSDGASAGSVTLNYSNVVDVVPTTPRGQNSIAPALSTPPGATTVGSANPSGPSVSNTTFTPKPNQVVAGTSVAPDNFKLPDNYNPMDELQQPAVITATKASVELPMGASGTSGNSGSVTLNYPNAVDVAPTTPGGNMVLAGSGSHGVETASATVKPGEVVITNSGTTSPVIANATIPTDFDPNVAMGAVTRGNQNTVTISGASGSVEIPPIRSEVVPQIIQALRDAEIPGKPGYVRVYHGSPSEISGGALVPQELSRQQIALEMTRDMAEVSGLDLSKQIRDSKLIVDGEKGKVFVTTDLQTAQQYANNLMGTTQSLTGKGQVYYADIPISELTSSFNLPSPGLTRFTHEFYYNGPLKVNVLPIEGS